MKGRKGVLKRGGGLSHAQRQSRDLAHPQFDQKVLAESTYLTVPEVVSYGHFQTKNAAYVFLSRWGIRVGAGRILRREFDRAWARAAERKQERRRRAHAA